MNTQAAVAAIVVFVVAAVLFGQTGLTALVDQPVGVSQGQAAGDR